MSSSTSALVRRVLAEDDVALVVDGAVETAKVGVTALALLNGSPEAALGLAAVAGLGGALLKRQEARLADFLRRWKRQAQRLSPDDRRRLEEQLQSEGGEALFEEAWRVAAGCVDPEKLDYLAELLSNGLTSETLANHQTRRLLSLLDVLDAVDFVILQGELAQNRSPLSFHSLSTGPQIIQRHKGWEEQEARFQAFRVKHTDIFADENPPAEPRCPIGEHNGETYVVSPEQKAQWEEDRTAYFQAVERHSLFENRLHHLTEIGVLGLAPPESFPRSDTRMQPKLTPLGMALLKIIGAAPDNEWGEGRATNLLQAEQQLRNVQAAREEERRALERSLYG